MKKILNKIYYRIFGTIIENQKHMNSLLKNTNTQIIDNQKQLEKIMNELEKCQNQLQDLAKVNMELLNIKENKNILIVGFYGAPNLGDELMLSTLLEYFDCDKQNITVMLCDNYSYSVKEYPKVNFIHYPKTRYDFNIIADKFDTIIFGGGAIIDEKEYHKENSYQYDLGTILIELSMRGIAFHKKMIYLGLSSNNQIQDEEYIKSLEYIINNASFFSVRDTISKKTIMKSIPTINDNQIHVINDIVLANKVLTEAKTNKKSNTIGIVWICTKENMNTLKLLLSKIDKKHKIKLIPFYDYLHNDVNLYQELLETLDSKDNIELLPYNNSIKHIVNTFDNCDTVISMRYHATLISLAREKNTISVCYDTHTHYPNKITYINKQFDNKKIIMFTSLNNDHKNFDKLISYLNEKNKSIDVKTKLLLAQKELNNIIKKEI